MVNLNKLLKEDGDDLEFDIAELEKAASKKKKIKKLQNEAKIAEAIEITPELKARARKGRSIKRLISDTKVKLKLEPTEVKSETKKVSPFGPQPGPQLDAIQATWCETLFYGGARGGGKTFFLLMDFLQDVQRYRENWHGVLFRRTYAELKDVIAQSFEIFPKCGAEWRESEKEWRFKEGSTLLFRYLDSYKDLPNYQGWQKTWLGFDELTNWADPIGFDQLKAILRSKHNIPTKRIRATGNPGGCGHLWVKERFIDTEPLGFQPYTDKHGERMFIPARVQDNLILLENDPGYIERLRQVGSPELVRAWLEGDWNAVLGAYFDVFSIERHVLPRWTPPKHWYRYRSFDWGSGAPFAVYWVAISDGEPVICGGYNRIFPRGSRIYYKEWYGAQEGKYNKGLGLNNEEMAAGILERSDALEKKVLTYTDGLPFQERGGELMANFFTKKGIPMLRGDTSRIPGWLALYGALKGNLEGDPTAYFTEDCRAAIRCIPSLQRSILNAEDVDTDQEDHSPDAIRISEMHMHSIKDSPVSTIEQDRFTYERALKKPTFNQMVKQNMMKLKKQKHHARFH